MSAYSTTTLAEKMDELLAEFDQGVKSIRDIHSNASFLNKDAQEYKEALERVGAVQARIWTLKTNWD